MVMLVLDSNGMTLFFILLFMNFSIFSWNSQGCASTKFPRVFREYNMEYKLDIISFFEPRVSGAKADKIIVKLGCQGT